MCQLALDTLNFEFRIVLGSAWAIAENVQGRASRIDFNMSQMSKGPPEIFLGI